MKPEVAMNWINALRSGNYKQGKDYLYENGKYCCLGVLDSLYPELNLSLASSYHLINYNKIGLGNSTGFICDINNNSYSLSSLNDEGYTFDEIADIIQIEYIEGL